MAEESRESQPLMPRADRDLGVLIYKSLLFGIRNKCKEQQSRPSRGNSSQVVLKFPELAEVEMCMTTYHLSYSD